jgi:putative hydrolases of HD superfamily
MSKFDENTISPLIDLLLSGLSIYRWNNFPRVRNITALDHLGFIAHIALLLAHILEEEGKEKYDISLLLKKILFSGFFTFFYSDISADVKDRLREKSKEKYEELEHGVYDKLQSLPLSVEIHEDILLIQKKTKEDILINFAKNWASYQEVESNAIVYPDAYAKLLESLELRFKKEEFLPFLEYLPINTSKKNPLENYLLVIHRLASSFRWNRSVRKYPVSVLSHTFIISFLTYLRGRSDHLEETLLTDMVITALFHDIPEAITGDIITPTKKSIPWLIALIEEVEQDMVDEYLLSYLEGYSFSSMYKQKMLAPWDEKFGKYVKQADIYSALHEARIEAPYSESFRIVYEEMKKKVEEFEK